jgi:hypothetical protein
MALPFSRQARAAGPKTASTLPEHFKARVPVAVGNNVVAVIAARHSAIPLVVFPFFA